MSAIQVCIDYARKNQLGKPQDKQSAATQAAAELAALRAVVEAARYVVGETHGVYDDSVPDTFKAHLTVGDIRYLAAALERVTK